VDEQVLLYEEKPHWWSDRRAELTRRALVCGVLVLLLAMFVFVVAQGWPSFAHNGLGWFASNGNTDDQIRAIFNASQSGAAAVWTFHAWPLIWATLLISGFAIVLSLICALFVAVFLVEFAPDPMKRLLQPILRLLASVPSVIYGLIGVVVIVPFIDNDLITQSEKTSVAYVISLSGSSLAAGVLILTVMMTPLMTAIFADGMRSIPKGWVEGSLALGVNRWRTHWKIVVRAARPAIIAGTVLALARSFGEAVMLSMVAGNSFAPNFADGRIFFFEPARPLAAMIIENTEGLNSPVLEHTVFAIATLLLVSALCLSFGGWAAKQPLSRYGIV
jgi:ABC-type phosphate transport system permease subunit